MNSESRSPRRRPRGARDAVPTHGSLPVRPPRRPARTRRRTKTRKSRHVSVPSPQLADARQQQRPQLARIATSSGKSRLPTRASWGLTHHVRLGTQIPRSPHSTALHHRCHRWTTPHCIPAQGQWPRSRRALVVQVRRTMAGLRRITLRLESRYDRIVVFQGYNIFSEQDRTRAGKRATSEVRTMRWRVLPEETRGVCLFPR